MSSQDKKRLYYTKETHYTYDGYGMDQTYIEYIPHKLTDKQVKDTLSRGVELYDKNHKFVFFHEINTYETPYISSLTQDSVSVSETSSNKDVKWKLEISGVNPIYYLSSKKKSERQLELQIIQETGAFNILVIPVHNPKKLFTDLEQAFPWIPFPNSNNQLTYIGTILFHFHECVVPDPLIVKGLTIKDRSVFIQQQIQAVYNIINTYYPIPSELKSTLDDTVSKALLNAAPHTGTKCHVQTQDLSCLKQTFL